jgi:hypothetical protein
MNKKVITLLILLTIGIQGCSIIENNKIRDQKNKEQKLAEEHAENIINNGGLCVLAKNLAPLDLVKFGDYKKDEYQTFYDGKHTITVVNLKMDNIVKVSLLQPYEPSINGSMIAWVGENESNIVNIIVGKTRKEIKGCTQSYINDDETLFYLTKSQIEQSKANHKKLSK